MSSAFGISLAEINDAANATIWSAVRMIDVDGGRCPAMKIAMRRRADMHRKDGLWTLARVALVQLDALMDAAHNTTFFRWCNRQYGQKSHVRGERLRRVWRRFSWVQIQLPENANPVDAELIMRVWRQAREATDLEAG